MTRRKIAENAANTWLFFLKNIASIDIMKRARKNVHINGISCPIRELRLYSIPIT
jgi:hypothetical protein